MPVPCVCQNSSCGRVFSITPSRAKNGHGQYCSQRCRQLANPLHVRFWTKVLICPHGLECPYCCWPWQRTRNSYGYGRIFVMVDGEKKVVFAQRVAWELSNNRPFPPGLFGLHHCDFPACCNPGHIYPGTPRENALDMVRRNRQHGQGRQRYRSGEIPFEASDNRNRQLVVPGRGICQNPICGKEFTAPPGRFTKGGRKYCSQACAHQNRTQFGALPRPLAIRLWEKIQICEHGKECPYCCWPWRGYTDQAGYGRLSVKRDGAWTHKPASRLIWEVIHNREMPIEVDACHHCDNPSCCNDMHIYPGTVAQNMQDRKNRGRFSLAPQHGPGEKNGNAKLQEKDIPLVWSMHREGKSHKSIGDHLHVSGSTIQAVLIYRSWALVSHSLTDH